LPASVDVLGDCRCTTSESTLTWRATCTTSSQPASVTCLDGSSTSRSDRARASASPSASRLPTSTPRTTTSGRGRRSSARTSAATTTWRRAKASTSTAPPAASSRTESSSSPIRPGHLRPVHAARRDRRVEWRRAVRIGYHVRTPLVLDLL